MVRESLTPGSRFALMLMTPGANGASFHYRTATGGNAAPSNSADKTSRPAPLAEDQPAGQSGQRLRSADGLPGHSRTA